MSLSGVMQTSRLGRIMRAAAFVCRSAGTTLNAGGGAHDKTLPYELSLWRRQAPYRSEICPHSHRPTTLVVVVAAVTLMSIFGSGDTGIKIVGELPSGLPAIGLPNIHVSDFSELIPTALACFILAYGEAISVARSFA